MCFVFIDFQQILKKLLFQGCFQYSVGPYNHKRFFLKFKFQTEITGTINGNFSPLLGLECFSSIHWSQNCIKAQYLKWEFEVHPDLMFLNLKKRHLNTTSTPAHLFAKWWRTEYGWVKQKPSKWFLSFT